MALRPWILSPTEWGEWGTRFNAWMKDLVSVTQDTEALAAALNDDLTALEIDVAAAEADIVALEGVGKINYTIVPADIYTGWGLSADPQYSPAVTYRNRDGLVGMDGVLVVSVARAAFANTVQLRTGYRPPVTIVLPVDSSVAGMALYIYPNGIVQANKAIGVGEYISLGGVSFRT